MRILVYPHELGLGGSQLNAVELAAAVRDLGHEVAIYGRPGSLADRIDELELEVVESPLEPGRRPSQRVIRHLRALVRQRSFDIIHGYEWPPILEARLASLDGDSCCVGTVMSMSVAPFIPRRVPLVVGTEQIADEERTTGRTAIRVLEPPVDLQHNHPGVVEDTRPFAESHGLDPTRPTVVVVSRLARELKLEGLLCAIRTVPGFAAGRAVLVVVGDGPERDSVARAAEVANDAAGREAVVLTGAMNDPRAAYTVADVVLGMGGSALRAMAFAKPLVVQGELGFWRALTSETVEDFGWQGWYGVGSGSERGAEALRAAVEPLLASPELRAAAGAFALDLVRSKYGLDAAAANQVQFYEAALVNRAGHRLDIYGDIVAAGRFAGHVVGRKVQRRMGSASTDDFNSRPVAGGTRRLAARS